MSDSLMEEFARLARTTYGVHPYKPQGDGCRCHLPEDDQIHAFRIDVHGYATAWSHGLETLRHLGGVDWLDAPAPPRKHQCWPQTIGLFIVGGRPDRVHRCACGAISRGDGYWMDRNSRRDSPPLVPWWRRVLRSLRPVGS